MTRTMIAGAAVAALVAASVHTQSAAAPAMQMPTGGAGPDAPSTAAFKSAMTSMEHGMSTPYTGDADRDFVSGMIPHHKGAVDMAVVELKYGKDPALKKLARDIVAAQRREIAFMERWRSEHTPK